MEPATVTATAAAVGLLSKARAAMKKLRNDRLADQHQHELADLDDTVTELSDRLFAQQAKMLELLNDIAALRAKISESENWSGRLAKYKTVQTAGGCFVLESVDADPAHFACPTCAETKHEIHFLHRATDISNACGSCHTRFAMSVRQQTEVQTRRWK